MSAASSYWDALPAARATPGSSSNGKWIDVFGGTSSLDGEEGDQEEMTRGARDPGCQESCVVLEGKPHGGEDSFFGAHPLSKRRRCMKGGDLSSPLGLDLTRSRESSRFLSH